MQPFRKLLSSRIYILSFLEALIAAACFVAVTFLYDPIDATIYLMYGNGLQHIGFVTLTFLIANYLFDSYKQIHVRSRLVLVLQLLQLIGLIFMTQAAFAFLDTNLVAPQSTVVMGSGLTLIVLIIWRLFIRPAVWTAIGAQRVVFVGFGGAVERLGEAFRDQPDMGMDLVGYILEPHAMMNAAPVLGSYRELTTIVADLKPDRIIVGSDGLRDKGLLKTLFDLRSAGFTVESAADVYEALFGRIYSPAIEPYTVIFRHELSARPGSVALQSIYTNILALAAVILTLPFMAIIAIIIKLTRKGAVLVKHACVGLHGVPFNRYRFSCDDSAGGAFSRFLLRYRLEALPQILNIVRGEMALIGPRAERVEFSQVIDELIPFYRQKHSVKPGVMGWSQLHCDVSATENSLARLEYDLYYIKHISLVLDAYVLLRALKWILSDRNANDKLVLSTT